MSSLYLANPRSLCPLLPWLSPSEAEDSREIREEELNMQMDGRKQEADMRRGRRRYGQEGGQKEHSRIQEIYFGQQEGEEDVELAARCDINPCCPGVAMPYHYQVRDCEDLLITLVLQAPLYVVLPCRFPMRSHLHVEMQWSMFA